MAGPRPVMEDAELRIVVIVSTDPSDLYFANQLARRFELAGILLEHQRDPPDRRPRWRKLVGLLCRPRELSGRLAEFIASRWHRRVSRRVLDVESADFGEEGRRLDPVISVPVFSSRRVQSQRLAALSSSQTMPRSS